VKGGTSFQRVPAPALARATRAGPAHPSVLAGTGLTREIPGHGPKHKRPEHGRAAREAYNRASVESSNPSDHLLSQAHNGALALTLNRPSCRNALSRALIADLTTALRTAGADEAVRCVTLTGSGPAFCAGLDLREVAAATPPQAEQDSVALLTLFETLDELHKPVIALVNGHAVAGGAGLVTLCDVVLAASSATIGYPEIQRGLVAAIVMTYLRRRVSEMHAKQLLLTGESVGAQRAYEMGLVTEVVADDQLPACAARYAAQFAALPPGPLAATKRLWSRLRGMSEPDALQLARTVNAAMRTTRESQQGADAFLKP
jgi:methylglutaconyl-CoA hydratase